MAHLLHPQMILQVEASRATMDVTYSLKCDGLMLGTRMGPRIPVVNGFIIPIWTHLQPG